MHEECIAQDAFIKYKGYLNRKCYHGLHNFTKNRKDQWLWI